MFLLRSTINSNQLDTTSPIQEIVSEENGAKVLRLDNSANINNVPVVYVAIR